jgi:hypothetical protein
VQVIAGHKCTQVPQNVDLCDHLEEAMFPLEALAQEYIVVPPVQSPNDKEEHGQVVRVIASEPNTKLTFTPDQGVATRPGKNAGDFVELVSTTARFQVVGRQEDPGRAVHGRAGRRLRRAGPVDAAGGRDRAVPQGLPVPRADVVDRELCRHHPQERHAGEVDGQPVAGFLKIPMTEYSVAHVKLSNDGDGNHTLTASERVGISVYGIQDFGSYWVVGGLDLDHL